MKLNMLVNSYIHSILHTKQDQIHISILSVLLDAGKFKSYIFSSVLVST